MPPKAAPKGKSASITDFFKKKTAAAAAKDDEHDDDFQQTSNSSKIKVSIPETKVKVKEETKSEPKSKPKPKAQPQKTVTKTEPKSQPKVEPKTETKPTASKEKRSRKVIVMSDSESDYEDNKNDNDDDDDDKFSEGESNDDNEDDYEEEEDVKPVKKQATKKSTASSSSSKPKNPVKKEEAVKEEESTSKPAFSKAKSYRDMLSRAPPKALGSRPEPQGKPNCLANLTFVFSGQFDTLTKEQVKDVIMRYGGRLTTGVSGKTNYLLRGRDAGETKTSKAKSLGTKILDEDGFYHLIEGAKEQKVDIPVPPSPSPAANKGKKRAADSEVKTDHDSGSHSEKAAPPESSLLWTEKYKPKSLTEVIGNKETVNRISKWVADWKENYSKGFPESLGDMFSKRALLLSGPPGIGKSTTAGLVAKENGFEAVEFNASDVRSKKVLEENLTEMIDNRSMTEFFQASNGERSMKKQKTSIGSNPRSKKVLLIMDEVDGMSSGDRGGAVELAALIRKTKIPIICICNDIRSQKVQPLLKVCADVRFRRTPANQIRSRIMSIAYKEKLGIQPNAVDELVSATQNDIRQIINILSTYSLSKNQMAYDDAKKFGKSNSKNSQIGLFDIPGALLSMGAWKEKTIEEKSEVYFYDYDRADLMIQENYLKSKPALAEEMSKTGNPREIACNELELAAKAAEAIAEGDYISAQIHGTVQQYSLMPVHSILSCVRPASFMYGHLRGRVDFPAWLGKNSSTTKYSKLLNDIQARMSRHSSADRNEIREYYLPVLSARIFSALEKEDYDTAIKIMDEYDLTRENLDTISELQVPSSTKGPMAKLPSKVKSTFTRLYNRTHHDTLFHDGGAAIKKTTSGPKEDLIGTIVAEEEPEESNDEAEQVDELEELKKSNELKVITKVKGDTGPASKKRKATAATSGAGSSKKRSKK